MRSNGVVDREFPYRPLPEHELWSADVAWVSQARYDSIDKWLEGSPELVIEVKSPSNTKHELEDKAMTTLAGGAVQFWVVDQSLQTVVAYTRSSGIHVYRDRAQLIPAPMFGASLTVESLFFTKL